MKLSTDSSSSSSEILPENADLFGHAPSLRPRNYADIKALAKATGQNIPDMLAMSCNNDPFYIMPAQEKQAAWFADLWERFNLPVGVHLRRIHYKLVSQAEPVLMVDGRPYQNTIGCASYLGNASKAARCLMMVAADSFQDQRNPDPVLHREYPAVRQPRLFLNRVEWDLPRIDADLADALYWRLPRFDMTGYSSNAHNDPLHLEMISEKSTMDDVVIPLCQELDINYAPATGFQSITGVIDLLKRLRHAVKAESDEFDPALPDRYESPLTLPDQFPGLFDSRRTYLEQLAFYKKQDNAATATEVQP